MMMRGIDYIGVSVSETVDVVDEENKVLYSISKENAHKEELLHRTKLQKL